MSYPIVFSEYDPKDEDAYSKGLEIRLKYEEKYNGRLKRVQKIAEIFPTVPAKSGIARKLADAIRQEKEYAKLERKLLLLTPKQIEAVGAFLGNKYITTALVGGNRSGKSFAASVAYALYLRDFAPPKSMHWAIAVEQAMSAGVQQKTLWDLLPPSLFGETRWKNSKIGFADENPVVTLDKETEANPNGRNVILRFRFQSQYQRNIKSFESENCDTLWMDECVQHDCYSAAYTRILLSQNRKVLMSTIPSEEFIHDAIHCSSKEDKVWFEKYFLEDNPVMTPGMIEEYINNIPEEERVMRLEGNIMRTGGLVFQEFSRSKHVVIEEAIPLSELTWYAGLDVGRIHFTVWLLVGISKDGILYVVDEYKSKNKTAEQDVEAILPIIKTRCKDKKIRWGTIIDPSASQLTKANTLSVSQQYQKAGLRITPGRRTAQVGETNIIGRMKESFRANEIKISEHCEQLIRELSIWSYRRDRYGRLTGTDSYEDKNNDAIDALKYVYGRNPTWISSQEENSDIIAIPYT